MNEAGRYLAFGGNPSKVGTRVQDIPGIAGDQLVHDIVAQAQHATRVLLQRLLALAHRPPALLGLGCLQPLAGSQ